MLLQNMRSVLGSSLFNKSNGEQDLDVVLIGCWHSGWSREDDLCREPRCGCGSFLWTLWQLRALIKRA